MGQICFHVPWSLILEQLINEINLYLKINDLKEDNVNVSNNFNLSAKVF